MDDWKIWLGLLGGIGGAIASFLLGRLATRRARPILWVRERLQEFELPSGSAGEIKVSFRGTVYDHLSYRELLIANTGIAIVPAGVFHAVLDESADVVEAYSIASPENLSRRIRRDEALPPHKLVLEFGELRPGDRVQYGLLVSGKGNSAHQYRGDPLVRVVQGKLSSGEDSLTSARFTKTLAIVYWVMLTLLGCFTFLVRDKAKRPFGPMFWLMIILVVVIFLGTIGSTLVARRAARAHRMARMFVPAILGAAQRREGLAESRTVTNIQVTSAVEPGVAPDDRPRTAARG
jgi:hypothetical protein